MSFRPLEAEARAKINWTLEVYGVRADGYHGLRSVVLPVTLSDTLKIEESETLSTDTGYEDDLILKAARLMAPGRGAKISVAKRIPAGGGLGGGSADAAAAIRALNEFWGLGMSEEAMMELGAKVGSDVPALVYGEPCVMEGRGEKVRLLTEAEAAELGLPMKLVIANPGVHSSTREVYGLCRCREGQPEGAAGLKAVNDLEAAAISLHPEIGALKELMGAGAMMSGSGSSVFKRVSGQEEGAELVRELQALGYWATVCDTWGR